MLSPHERLISLLLDQHWREAERMNEMPWHWGDSGELVSMALVAIETAIRTVHVPAGYELTLADQQAWYRQVRAAIEHARDEFRAHERDPEAIGTATFHQVLRALARHEITGL